MKTDKKFWSQEVVKGGLIWPDEHVIRFIKRNYQKGNECILDFGGGAGRDTIALATYGYHMTIMDYNETGLEICKERAQGLGLENISCVCNKGLHVEVNDDVFDAAFANGSLFYYEIDEAVRLLKDLKRVLKPGGKLWASWRTTQDFLCKNGQVGLYKLDDDKRNGINYFFADRITIADIYTRAGFRELSIDLCEYTENNGTRLCSWWHVVGTK